ncbi:MAG: heme exporter protein CcmB [Candidatus Kapaibacterium sp.]|nr:heme exporter protein CcmB [Bacteroidota bacterium]
MLKPVVAVFQKDIRSELRTRYSISAVLLFVVTSIVILLFATSGEKLTTETLAGILWVVMFFSSMTGLAKGFVSEEERGTSLLLQLTSSPTSVYFGKFIFNTILSLGLNALTVLLFFIFFDTFAVKNPLGFITTMFFGSIGIASSSTIISAIIAKANTKGALFPVLSLPMLLPLVFVGVEALSMSMNGTPFMYMQSDILIIISYSVIVTVLSWWLFDFVWKE